MAQAHLIFGTVANYDLEKALDCVEKENPELFARYAAQFGIERSFVSEGILPVVATYHIEVTIERGYGLLSIPPVEMAASAIAVYAADYRGFLQTLCIPNAQEYEPGWFLMSTYDGE